MLPCGEIGRNTWVRIQPWEYVIINSTADGTTTTKRKRAAVHLKSNQVRSIVMYMQLVGEHNF